MNVRYIELNKLHGNSAVHTNGKVRYWIETRRASGCNLVTTSLLTLKMYEKNIFTKVFQSPFFWDVLSDAKATDILLLKPEKTWCIRIREESGIIVVTSFDFKKRVLKDQNFVFEKVSPTRFHFLRVSRYVISLSF